MSSKKLIRLTEGDLRDIVAVSTKMLMEERRDNNEIRHAQSELMKMGPLMSSVCLRLEDTKYEGLAKRMRDAIVALNNALITDISKMNI